ncbi:MAG TPA: hypothetical protein DCY62_01485 [Thalassospira sp.]|nr:hypothetical protein [Thalassospira sp.]
MGAPLPGHRRTYDGGLAKAADSQQRAPRMQQERAQAENVTVTILFKPGDFLALYLAHGNRFAA